MFAGVSSKQKKRVSEGGCALKFKNLREFSVSSNNNKLDPQFVTGFADAECSFSILIQANSKYATG